MARAAGAAVEARMPHPFGGQRCRAASLRAWLPAPQVCYLDPPSRPAPAPPQLQAALQLLDATTRPVLAAATGELGTSWGALKAHLIRALQDMVDAFPQDHYPPPRRLDPSHVDAFAEGAADLAASWAKRMASEDAGGARPGGASPAARLHAALMLQQLEDVGAELQRAHGSAQAAMGALERSLYGFLGFPCCRPAA
jgi:hypothetical protein